MGLRFKLTIRILEWLTQELGLRIEWQSIKEIPGIKAFRSLSTIGKLPAYIQASDSKPPGNTLAALEFFFPFVVIRFSSLWL